MSRKNAELYSLEPHTEKSAIISIRDDYLGDADIVPTPENGIKDVLFMAFEDVDGHESGVMSQKDADAIVDFVSRHLEDVDVVIVHCMAGISRSAGVCAALVRYFQ